MCMAAAGIKGLIYLDARACFPVHSGISYFSHAEGKNRLGTRLPNEHCILSDPL